MASASAGGAAPPLSPKLSESLTPLKFIRRMRRVSSTTTAMPMRCMRVVCAAQKKETTNPLVKLAVGAVTELLRIFSRQEQSGLVSASTTPSDVSVATVDDLIVVLKYDYKRSYFLTGEFTASVYAEDCWFEDPTIKFNGRDLYQRNLQLLVSFFENPSLLLSSIKQGVKGKRKFIEAKWQLRTYLKLPWRPLISLEGSTVYDLDDNLKIINHVESWNISPIEAITQIFIPSSDLFSKK